MPFFDDFVMISYFLKVKTTKNQMLLHAWLFFQEMTPSFLPALRFALPLKWVLVKGMSKSL